MIKIIGYDHMKVGLQNPEAFEKILTAFGFSKVSEKIPDYLAKPYSVWGSGEAFFSLYEASHPLAKESHAKHGDWIFDLSYRVDGESGKYEGAEGLTHTLLNKPSFSPVQAKKGLMKFDHNTINVQKGALESSVRKYESDFGFERGQYFKIQGKQTGLFSWVTRTPNYGVQMPFNEAADDKSQIEEYIRIHHGGGVQHAALVTPNIIQTMDEIRRSTDIRFLDLPDTYYEVIEKKIKTREPMSELRRLRIQADQDESGYLLQIFTQYLFGGFFFELIQREGNRGFGEGNFQALFEAIELDQKRRGVI